MRSARGRQLVERFLGAAANHNGPFGLLGIDPSACTPSGVESALQRQLDRVAHHPDSESTDADEVRLVLDTAAMELLDPVTRARWIDELKRPDAPPEQDPVEIAPPASEPSHVFVTAAPRDKPAEREASRSGDPLVKRLLMTVLVSFGLMVLGTALATWLLTTPPPAPVAPAPAPTTATPAAEKASSQTGGATDGAAATTAATQPADPPPEPLAPLRVRGRSEFADGAHVVRELRAAAAGLADNPDQALARFERAHAAAADWWCRYDTAQVRAAADAVVECVYRAASRPDHMTRLLAMISDPAAALSPGQRGIQADEVWPAAWSAGILARVNRERDLPPQVAAGIGRALGQVLARARAGSGSESTLESGFSAAIKALPAAILAGKPARGDEAEQEVRGATAAMQRWVEAVTLTSGADADLRERQLVDALSWIITDAADPEADARVFESMSLLASEIKWRPAGPARGRLIEWFRDPRVSNNDLRAITSAIATRSSAEGVDPSMVLSMSAKGDDRLQLRARYAGAWGLAEASTREDSARDWVARARVLAEFEPRSDELDQLAATADLAEINREAAKLWRGERAASAGTTPAAAPAPGLTPTVPSTPPSPGSSKLAQPASPGGPPTVATGVVTGGGRDGAWAERYLAAERNIPVRLERLAELDQMGPPIGWVDAAVLTEAAAFGSPVQIRAAAQKLVAKYADEPAMVSAVLDALPGMPRVRSVSEMVARVGLATLPRPGDADWELLARRALVERLLAMLADDGIHGAIEQLAIRIAAAYLDAAGEPAPDFSTDASATGARRGAELLVESTRREAEGLPISPATRFNLDQIIRRRDQRRAQAIGPVQAFGAEQAALAESLGYLIASERPEREPAVAALLEEMSAQRRRAGHAFAQVWAAERAITRLWLARFSEEEQQ